MTRIAIRSFSLFVLLAAAALPAMALNVVNTSSPAVDYNFGPLVAAPPAPGPALRSG
jgi:hypothetical protein